MRNNPLVVGPRQIGKTSVIYAYAAAAAQGRWDFPSRRVMQVDLPKLAAGAADRTRLGERIRGVIDEAKRDREILLVIDDLGSVLEDELQSAALSYLRLELADAELQCIFTAQEDEFRETMRQCRWLEPLVQVVAIASTTRQATAEILRHKRARLEEWYKVKFSDESLELAVDLSDLYFVPKCQPANALQVLDEAASRKRFDSSIPGPDVQASREELEAIRARRNAAIKGGDFEVAAAIRDEEKAAKDNLEQLLVSWREEQAREVTVSESDIYRAVSGWLGIEEEKLIRREAVPQQEAGTE